MKNLLSRNLQLTDVQVISIFSGRRKFILTILIVYLFTVFLDIAFDAAHSFHSTYNYAVGFILFGLAIAVIYIYRCPRCGDLPKSSQVGTSGILIFPRKCSKCGAPLMPNHKWAQD